MRATIPYPQDYELTLARIIAVRLKGLQDQARALEQVLGRLHHPDYGACHGCGEPIPFAELEADPAAERCATCSKGER